MKKSKVVFVRPPNLQKSGQWKKQGVIRCPLNIAMLAAYVRRHGHYDCSLVDFEIIAESSADRMAEIILRESPRYVCLTTLTPRFPTVVNIARAVKGLNPDVITIAGGPHVTGSPFRSLCSGIDYAVAGEGEQALLETLDALESARDLTRIPNLIFRDREAVRVNPQRPFIRHPDELPFPAWDLMSLGEYTDPAYFDGSHLALFTSRGCPYDCSFCASCVTWKGRLRMRSPGSVLAEIREIVQTHGIRNLMFWDDTFAANRQRALDICRMIEADGLGIKYTVQLRADSVTDELVNALKRSGCSFAAIGVESGNEGMLKRIGKRETKAQIRTAVARMKSGGLPVIASYIIGLPGDSHDTIRETIDFAFELDADQSKFMILAPYPGTAVYELAMNRGLADPASFEQMQSLNYYDSVAINLSKVSDRDLIRYQDDAYAHFDGLKQTA